MTFRSRSIARWAFCAAALALLAACAPNPPAEMRVRPVALPGAGLAEGDRIAGRHAFVTDVAAFDGEISFRNTFTCHLAFDTDKQLATSFRTSVRDMLTSAFAAVEPLESMTDAQLAAKEGTYDAILIVRALHGDLSLTQAGLVFSVDLIAEGAITTHVIVKRGDEIVLDERVEGKIDKRYPYTGGIIGLKEGEKPCEEFGRLSTQAMADMTTESLRKVRQLLIERRALLPPKTDA